jgi:hypothetical protein
MDSSYAPSRRPGWLHLNALHRLADHEPMCIGSQTLAEQGRWQWVDSRSERAPDSLGGLANVSDHAHKQAATLENSVIAGQRRHGLVVHQVFFGRDGDRRPVVGDA